MPKSFAVRGTYGCPSTKKETQILVSLFGFQRPHTPSLGVLLRPIYEAIQMLLAFNEETSLQQVQVAVQAALSLGS